MTRTEAERHDLYNELVRVIGKRSADTLMDHLRPSRFEDLATKADVEALRLELGQRIDGLGQRIDGLGQRIDGLGQRIGGVDGRIDSVDARIDRMGVAMRADFDRLRAMMRTYLLGIIGGFSALLAAIITTGFLG